MSVKVKFVATWMSTSAKPRLTWNWLPSSRKVSFVCGCRWQWAACSGRRHGCLCPSPARVPNTDNPILRLERSAEFEQRVGGAHFFERKHVGIQCADAFADFVARLNGFDVRTPIRSADPDNFRYCKWQREMFRWQRKLNLTGQIKKSRTNCFLRTISYWLKKLSNTVCFQENFSQIFQ